MNRLLLFWSNPYHLTDRESETWIGEEVGRLTALDGLHTAELTRLRRASAHFDGDHDWMLELRLGAGVDGREWIGRPECTEWLVDLRLLGMRPSVAFAEPGSVLG